MNRVKCSTVDDLDEVLDRDRLQRRQMCRRRKPLVMLEVRVRFQRLG
jgi:hypothetical protein